MNIINFIKKKYKMIIAAVFLSLIPGLLVYRSAGIKDTAMFCLATFMLIIEIYLIFLNKKISLLMFIISFPILVTARKLFYVDLLFLKLTYESVYISLIFIASFKGIKEYIKAQFTAKGNSHYPNFIILIAIFIIFAFNSSMFAQDIMNSMGMMFISVLIPAMFALSVLANFNSEDKLHIYYSLIIGVVFSDFYGFFQIITSHVPLSKISGNRELFTFGYHNINIFAGILTLIIPYALELILYRKNSKKEKLFLYLSLFVCIVALLLTFTRGAWLSFIITLFIILISKRYRKVLYVLFAGFLVVAKPLIEFILGRGNVAISLLKNESSIARIHSLFTSINIIAQYPFGTGSGSFAQMYNEYAVKGYLLMPEKFRWSISVANYALESAHNLWLEISVELGIVCAVVFLLIIINRILIIFDNYKENRANFTALVVYLMFSVLTGVEFNHKGVITHTLIIWLIFAMVNLSGKEGSNIEKHSKKAN
jgi:Lipid A core - O-antigen ligase and related enzymes